MNIVRIDHVLLAMPAGREDDARRFYRKGLPRTSIRGRLSIGRGDVARRIHRRGAETQRKN